MNSEPYNAYIGKHAALLSLVEIGLGSLLHGLRFPLSGHFLSCNQGFLLCRSIKEAPENEKTRLLGATVSNVAAILKSLSPAGKKLTPMLAISSQGFLFSLGTLILGPNFFGCLLGITLLSLWAFAQPLMLAYFMFGSYLLEGIQKLFKSIEEAIPALNWDNFIAIALSLVGLKILICWALCTFVYFSDIKVEKYFKKMEEIGLRQKKSKLQKRKTKSFWSFLFQPLFVISFAITIFFFIYSEREKSQFIWLLIRPLAAALLLYFVALWLPLNAWIKKLQSGRYSRFGNALGYALAYLRNSDKNRD